MKVQSYYRLYPNVKFVMGSKRDAFYNLNNGEVYFVDPMHRKLIKNLISNSYTKSFTTENIDLLNEIIEANLGFIDTSGFSYIDLEDTESYFDNFHINSLCLYRAIESDNSVLSKLIDIPITRNLIACFTCNDMTSDLVIKMLSIIYPFNKFLNYEIYLIYNESFVIDEVSKIINKFPLISKVMISDSPIDVKYIDEKLLGKEILYTTFKYSEEVNYFTNSEYFNYSKEFFNEAITVNPFYYKKLYIDEKNVLSYFRSSGEIGNISTLDLKKVGYFTHNIWSVSKSNIKKCMDCEFKFCCNDPRIPKIKFNCYEYETDCGYNPYS